MEKYFSGTINYCVYIIFITCLSHSQFVFAKVDVQWPLTSTQLKMSAIWSHKPDEKNLYFVNNISKQNIIFYNEKNDRMFSIKEKYWAAFVIGKKPVKFECIQVSNGSELFVPCDKVLRLCSVRYKDAGGKFIWFGEVKKLLHLQQILAQHDFNVVLVQTDDIDDEKA